MTKLILFLTALFPVLAFAAEETVKQDGGSGFHAIGAAVAIAVGALGGALAQGRLAASAMEGIARNPQAAKSMFVPFMIGLGLIESLVIYCLIIAMTLAG